MIANKGVFTIKLWIILLVLTVLIILGAATYFLVNFYMLIRLKKESRKSFSDLDVLLKHQAEELPNLILLVRKYAQNEKNILDHAAKAKTVLAEAKTLSERIEASLTVTEITSKIFIVAEQNLEFRNNIHFQEIRERMKSIAKEIETLKNSYSASILGYRASSNSGIGKRIVKIIGYEVSEGM